MFFFCFSFQLDGNKTCFTVDAERSIKVANLKPAIVNVYNYYQPEESARTFYLPDKVDVCDICEERDCQEKCKMNKQKTIK